MRKQFFGIFSLLLLISVELFSQNKKDFVPYNVVVTQGNYRTIAVSKENRTREKLLLLGNELEEQNKNTYQICILVFDDEKAAKLYSKIDNLTAVEDKFYAEHYIATYWKSPSARHDFTIMLDGMNGSIEKIDYKDSIKTNDSESSEKKYEATATDDTIGKMVSTIFFLWIVGLIVVLCLWKKFRYKVWFEFFVALFLGFFGVQKFREKKIGLGVLYIFTAGCFYIGWSIDVIRYFIAAIRNKPILPVETTCTPKQELITFDDVSELPVVQPLGLILQGSEVCHFSENANYVEIKNVVVGRRINGGGRSARIFGIRVSAGSAYSQSVRDNIAIKTPGTFSITSQRVVFSGMKGAFNKKLSDITALTGYDDGIGFQFNDKHFVIQMENAPLAQTVLSLLLSASQN
nr:TM2 domain-containing protein [Treponema sp.]